MKTKSFVITAAIAIGTIGGLSSCKKDKIETNEEINTTQLDHKMNKQAILEKLNLLKEDLPEQNLTMILDILKKVEDGITNSDKVSFSKTELTTLSNRVMKESVSIKNYSAPNPYSNTQLFFNGVSATYTFLDVPAEYYIHLNVVGSEVPGEHTEDQVVVIAWDNMFNLVYTDNAGEPYGVVTSNAEITIQGKDQNDQLYSLVYPPTLAPIVLQSEFKITITDTEWVVFGPVKTPIIMADTPLGSFSSIDLYRFNQTSSPNTGRVFWDSNTPFFSLKAIVTEY